jgi:hypothetical protein
MPDLKSNELPFQRIKMILLPQGVTFVKLYTLYISEICALSNGKQIHKYVSSNVNMYVFHFVPFNMRILAVIVT